MKLSSWELHLNTILIMLYSFIDALGKSKLEDLEANSLAAWAAEKWTA